MNIDEIVNCPIFKMDHYQWTESYKPEAFGQMALLDQYGLVISMTAIENNPLCRHVFDDSLVYQDSALEAFLHFAPDQKEMGYCNFEMNASGALLSEFGMNRKREKIRNISSFKAQCKADINNDSWSVLLEIPMELICDLYHRAPLSKGDSFTCNFYKISEEPSIEHYASYSPISSLTPNFHMPECFSSAVIV